MPHNLDLILTLTGGLAAALVLGLVTQKLRLSPIVGYLLAGIAVGPFTPGFTAHSNIAEQLAELGVILLMFGVGLHFHLKELLAVWRIAIPGALVQVAIATVLGVAVTHFLDWSLTAGIVFGLAISVASTVVLLRVLGDAGMLQTRAGHIAVGWLLVEDLFTVLVLVLLPITVSQQSDGDWTGVAMSFGVALLKIGALVALMLVFGSKLIPKLLSYVAAARSRELFTLTVLVLALGLAVGAASLFGASMALGAFLAGMVVGQSEFSTRAASEALPMRDAFAVIFFVSMGMLLDPAALLPNLGLVLGTLAVILVGKPLAALAVVLILKHPPRTAFTVALVLAQIGEFSFILAALGRSLDILPEQATQALVAGAIISITLNPLLFRCIDPLVRLWPSPAVDPDVGNPQDDAHELALIVGYGPVGKSVATLLRENNVTPVVIELNHDTVRELRAQGYRAVYGDASQREVLEQAGIAAATSLVFASSGSPAAVIHQAVAMRPGLMVLTRATYVKEISELQSAGANIVVSSEGEVALAMTEHLLQRLGATAEQLDRTRQATRAREAGAAA